MAMKEKVFKELRPTIIDHFESCVASYPFNVAVMLENGEKLLYSELDLLATNIQNIVFEKITNITNNNTNNTSNNNDNMETPLVAVMMDRGFSFIVAMLGILKAGAAYVPVDPSFPPDRQIHIFTHSKCQYLIVDEACYEAAQLLGVDLPPLLHMDSKGNVKEKGQRSVINSYDADSIKKYRQENNDDRLAYVLYTSGSTGKPKGVMVQHAGVANIVNWFANELKVDVNSRVMGLTTFCFDISVLEMFLPLTRGGQLILAKTSTQKDPFVLLELMQSAGVTIFQATPTTYEMMLATGWKGNKSIDFLVLL
jgi:non-ribosomal peptide synthetase component F